MTYYIAQTRKRIWLHNKSHQESSCKKLIESFRSGGIGPAKISRIINTANGCAVDVDTSTMFLFKNYKEE